MAGFGPLVVFVYSDGDVIIGLVERGAAALVPPFGNAKVGLGDAVVAIPDRIVRRLLQRHLDGDLRIGRGHCQLRRRDWSIIVAVGFGGADISRRRRRGCEQTRQADGKGERQTKPLFHR